MNLDMKYSVQLDRYCLAKSMDMFLIQCAQKNVVFVII